MAHTGSGSPVQAIDRAAKLLDALSAAGASGAQLTALAERCELKASTAHSLLVALVQNGFAEQVEGRQGTYRLGTKLLELSRRFSDSTSLAEVGIRHARALLAATRETVFFSVLRNGERVDLIGLIGSNLLAVNPTAFSASYQEPKQRLHTSSVGKALLAALSDEQIVALLGTAPLPSRTDRTITAVSTLLDEVHTIREGDIARNDEEADPGVRGLALPVRDATGLMVAAVGIAFPGVRALDGQDQVLATQLRASAAAISADLGYQPPSL